MARENWSHRKKLQSRERKNCSREREKKFAIAGVGKFWGERKKYEVEYSIKLTFIVKKNNTDKYDNYFLKSRHTSYFSIFFLPYHAPTIHNPPHPKKNNFCKFSTTSSLPQTNPQLPYPKPTPIPKQFFLTKYFFKNNSNLILFLRHSISTTPTLFARQNKVHILPSPLKKKNYFL